MTTAVFFGSNSWLAKHFIQYSSGSFGEVIGISRSKSACVHLVDTPLSIALDKPISSEDYVNLIATLKAKSDLIFFFYAWVGTPRTSAGPKSDEIAKSNFWIISNYCRLINDILPAQVVFISSAGAIYPDLDRDRRNYSETCKALPSTLYGFQKLSCESILMSLCKGLRIPLVSLRISSAYGYNPLLPDQGVANLWLYSALNNKPLKIYNSLESEINFVADYQVSSALMAIVSRRLTGIYNLGTTNSTTLSSLLNAVKEIFYFKDLKIHSFSSNLRISMIDSKKLYDDIGFSLQSNILLDLRQLLELLS